MPDIPTIAPPQTPVEPKKPLAPSIPSAPTTEPEPHKHPLQPGPGIQPEPKDYDQYANRCKSGNHCPVPAMGIGAGMMPPRSACAAEQLFLPIDARVSTIPVKACA